MECKDKIQLDESLVEGLISVKDKKNGSNEGRRLPVLSTELSGKIFSFSDSGKQLDCRNSGHQYSDELNKTLTKMTESSPAASGILDKQYNLNN